MMAFAPFCFVATETQEVGLRGSRGFDAVAPCSRKNQSESESGSYYQVCVHRHTGI